MPALNKLFPFDIQPRGSFRRQIILTLVVGFFVLISAFVSYMVIAERSYLYRDSLDRTTSLAESLAVSARSWVLANDVVGLQEVMDSFQGITELRHAMVLSPGGRVLAHTDASRVGQFVSDPASRELLRARAENRLVADNANLIDIAVPIMLESRHVGWVRMSLGRERIAANVRAMVIGSAAFVLFATLLSLVAALFLAHRLGRRVSALAEVAREVQGGRRDVLADVQGGDEIATLGVSLNSMLGELARTEQHNRSLKDFYSSILESVITGVWVADREDTITYANRGIAVIAGIPAPRIEGRNVVRDFSQEELGGFLSLFLKAKVALKPEYYEAVLVRTPTGRPAFLSGWLIPIVRDGVYDGMICTMEDITERKRAEDALRESAAEIQDLYDNAPCGYHSLDQDGVFRRINQTELHWLGYARDEILGRKKFSELITPASQRFFQEHFPRFKVEGAIRDVEIDFVRKDGTILPTLVSATAIYDPEGRFVMSRTTVFDITERKHQEDRILRLAHYDALTDLPNRVLLNDRLRQALAVAQRQGNKLGVLFLDLDRFKDVNDSLGHAVGDLLLQGVVARIMESTRGEDTVARMGGDEFIVLLPSLHDAQDAATVAEKLVESMRHPLTIEGHELSVTLSIGIAVFPDDAQNAGDLVRNADTAMYKAKNSGRNNFQFYTQDMNRRALEALAMENSLRKALERGEFVLYYQPQIDHQSGAIIGAEALIRWRHPEQGLVPPGSFIPLAEERGLIVKIGQWVLREACRQIAAWRAAGLPPITVAVNLSAVQFHESGFLDQIVESLRETGVAPEYLELELTESIVMHDAETTIALLAALHGQGLKISIDDFGTGYSSLSYLQRFPIDKLKIDQSFVRNMLDDAGSANIVIGIIGLAKSLNLKVIAEGVETREQFAALRLHGCNEMQGYLFGRPVPAEDFAELLRERKAFATGA